MTSQDLLTIDQAAAEFGVHRTTLFRAISRKELRSHTHRGDRRTFVERSEVRRLVEDPTVQRCLQLAYDRFRTDAKWPMAREIQRELDRVPGAGFDFLAALETLPQELGWRVRDMEGRVQLTLRGISRCEGSVDDVNAFLALMRTCHERYVGDEDLTVTSGQLVQAFGFDALALERLFLMAQVEAGFWSGLGKNDREWSLEIEGERIRHFRDIRSLGDYLVAKQRAYQPREAPSVKLGAALLVRDADDVSLHPLIAEATSGLEDTAAVVAAAAAVEQLIAGRLRDGQRHGSGLIARYFDVALRASPPDVRRLEAVRTLTVSAFGAYRNLAAHGRMDFVGAQAKEIIGLFSLLTREIEAAPMPPMEIREIIPWVPFREARAETLAAFVAAGKRAYGWPTAHPPEVPETWFCDVHQDFLDRSDVGIAYGDGVETIPVCPTTNCAGRGWKAVHPERSLRALGPGGQAPLRIRTRIPKSGRAAT